MVSLGSRGAKLDSATDDLLKNCWSGRQFAKVTVSCYRSDGATDNKPVKYLTVVLQNVVISNFSVNGGAGDVPVENVSLDYGRSDAIFLLRAFHS